MDNPGGEIILVEVDRELMTIVPEYLVMRRWECAEIKRLLASGDMAGIQTLAHRMKGSGGSFGFDEISAIGEVLEWAAEIPDTGSIGSAVDRLERYLACVSVTYV
ncbi:MAG: Hpt domain-containing protein [Desulfobacteraceae bacterium]|nr:Hpt domain-containing protein [Desulfobacteraceae bacterium]